MQHNDEIILQIDGEGRFEPWPITMSNTQWSISCCADPGDCRAVPIKKVNKKRPYDNQDKPGFYTGAQRYL